MNFLAFIFYVKSLLENPEVLKLHFFAILGALSFVNSVNYTLQQVQKVIDIKFQSLLMWKNATCTSKISKIGFT